MALKNHHIACYFSLLVMASCNTYQEIPITKQPVSRVIILNEKDTISEKIFGRLISWECKDFINGDRTLVEVGYFDDSEIKNIGFILYDGSNKGETTYYDRAGLDLRWDWSPNGGKYAFIISPDGNGLYYDFTSVLEGESTKPRHIYKCKQK